MYAHSVMDDVVTVEERKAAYRKALIQGAIFGSIAAAFFYLASHAGHTEKPELVWIWLGIPAGYCWYKFMRSHEIFKIAIRKI
jgi:hypothetical protein